LYVLFVSGEEYWREVMQPAANHRLVASTGLRRKRAARSRLLFEQIEDSACRDDLQQLRRNRFTRGALPRRHVGHLAAAKRRPVMCAPATIAFLAGTR
jgi:hypothetical protein